MEVDSAADCEQGLAQAARGAEPDLVLLDMQLPGLSGLAAVRAWRTRFPLVPVVVLSGEQRRQAVLDALAAGAAGFVPKATSNEVLLGALRIVLDGGRYLPPLLLEPETTPRADDPLQALGLTVRQADVLRLLARGAPNKVIGRELGLAERTVKAHVTAGAGLEGQQPHAGGDRGGAFRAQRRLAMRRRGALALPALLHGLPGRAQPARPAWPR